MLVPIVAGPRLAGAQYPTDTLALSDAIGVARAANPALLAARLRADAAMERVSPAGALPDPQLSFGFRNWPTDFDTDQSMTMNSIQLMQRFPWPGKLKFGQERMRRLAAADRLETQETEVVLVARVKSVYYKVAYVDRALRIMEETRELLRDFYQVSSAMYGVGRGLQQDVLQAQVAIATMTEDITVMEQNRVAMVARLTALLGRAPTVPVEALELSGTISTWSSPRPLKSMACAMTRNSIRKNPN